MLPLQGVRVQSLGGELRFPHAAQPKKKKKSHHASDEDKTKDYTEWAGSVLSLGLRAKRKMAGWR